MIEYVENANHVAAYTVVPIASMRVFETVVEVSAV